AINDVSENRVEVDAGAGVAQRRGAIGADADDVAGDAVAGRPGVPHRVDLDAGVGVAADDVGLSAAAADEVIAGAGPDGDAGVGVGRLDVAGGVGADVVALDEVAGRRGVGEQDALHAVEADDVAGGSAAGADDVAGGAVEEQDAALGVADVGGAVGTEADVVAGDEVAVGVVQVDAALGVAADDVAFRGE